MENNATFKSYITGFLASVCLTVVPFILVTIHLNYHHLPLSNHLLLFVIVLFAIIQLFIQLVFFLHLGVNRKKRLNLYILLFAAFVIIIIVGGSLWIMNSLNYHMTQTQINQYMQHQDGF